MKVITTERLLIRGFVEADAPRLFELLKVPRADCFHSERLETLEAAREAANVRGKEGQFLAVCLRASGTLIGELMCLPEDSDTFSVGWNFLQDFEGRGLAFEAAQALVADLFRQGGARRIYAYVEEDNSRSQKLCLRLGMRREGLFQEFVSFVKGPDGHPLYVNTLQFAVLAKEWNLGSPE